jgi:hypothetical protein
LRVTRLFPWRIMRPVQWGTMGRALGRIQPPDRCHTSKALARLFLAFLFSSLLVSCGSGGGGTGSLPPAPSSDFSLSVAPTNAYLQTGTSTAVSLSASGSNGFSSSIAVTVSGLPAGVTVSPSTVTVKPGTPQPVTFSASASAAIANATVTFTGTSGALSHSVQAKLAVIQPITSNTPPFRMRYVRTDASTLYMAWENSAWIIYNPPTNRFFVTDPDGNRVYALDAATETVVGSIPVPGAFGIDDTPDHSTLYVGTQIGDVYAINPATMTVTKRYLASQIGPKGFHAYSVRVMADGRLALLGAQGGIPGVDGYGDFAIWNPADNSISLYASQYGAGYAGLSSGNYTQVCGSLLNIGVFTRTPDRTKVVIASADSDGTLCEVDESTGADQYVGDPANGFIWHLAISPDGTRIVLPYGPNGTNQVVVLDAHTLAQVSLINVAGDTSGGTMLFIGPDSRTLYMPSSNSGSGVYAYDLITGQQIGWLPNVIAQPYFSGAVGTLGPAYSAQFQAMDGTGLLAGPMEEGVGFVDTSTLRTGPVGTQYLNSYLSPAAGPSNGGTSTTWWVSAGTIADYPDPNHQNSASSPVGTITDAYFGSQKAPSVSTDAASGTISATTPPGAPGPTGVYALASDGGVDYVPEGFSYGPTILQVTPNEATAGGGTGFIYGYGFGPPTQSSSSIPAGLTVTIGGKPAKVTAFSSNAYGISSPPFPLQALSYTIPSGTAGTSADVSVTSSSGTATVHNGMTYLPAIQKYALAGSALAEGIYDPYTDLYYFTDATQIRVFSKTNGQWLPPITLPPADNPQRLWGIALSPDGSEMAVTDLTGQAIYVLSLSAPSNIQKFPLSQAVTGDRDTPGIAISDTGALYVAAWGYNGFFKLDTSSGATTTYNISPVGDYLRTLISSDNSQVYFNEGGAVLSIDTATDKVSYAQQPGCCSNDYDLALSSDQSRLAATGYFYDANLNAESFESPNVREAMNISYLYGEKLSPDGRLLFQPTNIGIDVLDGKLGNLLDRIALPVTLSPNYDALVSDGKDNDLIAITGASGDGIAEIDLTSITEPAPLPYSPSTATTTRFATLNTSPTTQRTSPPERGSAEAQTRPGLRGIRHKTVQNLLRRFRQKPAASH